MEKDNEFCDFHLSISVWLFPQFNSFQSRQIELLQQRELRTFVNKHLIIELTLCLILDKNWKLYISTNVRKRCLNIEVSVSRSREHSRVDISNSSDQTLNLRRVVSIDGDLCHLTVEGNRLKKNFSDQK